MQLKKGKGQSAHDFLRESATCSLMRNTFSFLVAMVIILISGSSLAGDLFDHKAIRDSGNLDIQVVQDWHEVAGPVPTRQKVINILVHEELPGQPYRIPVRFIVPKDRKAKGFHLTGGHQLRQFDGDAKIFRADEVLLKGGVGRVHTMIQVLNQSDQAQLGRALDAKFIETLDPKYSIQYYGWPLTLMKAITAAYAEGGHFGKGKIAMSGGSKNGATPSLVLNVDDRTTAVHGSVSPIWDSPLRLCEEAQWEKLNSYNKSYAASVQSSGKATRGRLLEHPFLGGTYGPIYNRKALAAGHSWQELKSMSEAMADNVFISRNVEQLKARGAEFLFQPGTHDFVCFDLIWGGQHHPNIPLYLRANSGHGIKPSHPQSEKGQDNLTAFLYQHFFDDFEGSRLQAPDVKCELIGDKLKVSVKFKAGSKTESGRIWWIYDRGPDGSAAYIRELFPDDQWADMKQAESAGAWTVEIPIKGSHQTIDFFSNHKKTLKYRGEDLQTYLSSPYQRVNLK